MSSRAPARRRHLQVVPEPHALLGRLLPPLDEREVEVAAERVREHGQREPIEILDGAIVAGWHEYMGCVEAGVAPTYTEIEHPAELVEYIVRRNVPRHLSKLDRACIAVLAQVEFKSVGLERMREGGRIGGSRKGKGRATVARPFEGERWTHTAARVVGTTEGAVRRLANIYVRARDVFDAVRDRRIEVMRDARDLAHSLKEPEARAHALTLRAHQPNVPFARIIADVTRARRPALPTRKGAPGLRGRTWRLHAGPMAEEAKKIPDSSIDLVHADIVYGSVAMAADAARVAARVLVSGGVLALIAGVYDLLAIQNAVADEGLTLVAIGSVAMPNLSYERVGLKDRVQRIDALPVFYFLRGTALVQPIRHLGHVCDQKEADGHRWQKNTATTLDIVSSVVSRGARVLDPCCGSGTTGEAALRHGCTFLGIDIDADAIKVASSRLAQVERELAEVAGGADRPRRTRRGLTTKTATPD